MNAPRLTDAQVSQALRAHLPDRAQAGLRERILEAAGTTGQQRPLPSFLGALGEADPVSPPTEPAPRRRAAGGPCPRGDRRCRGIAPPRA